MQYVGQAGWEWPLKETYPQARSMAIDLRKLGYEVNGRGNGQTMIPNDRDRLETRAFAEAFARAFPCFQPSPDYSGFLTAPNIRALDHASSNRSLFLLEGKLPPSCCLDCHFDTEDLLFAPYIRFAGLEVEAKALALEHQDLVREHLVGPAPVDVAVGELVRLRRHATDEMDLFRRANVPQRLLAWADAEHRQIDTGRMKWKKR